MQDLSSGLGQATGIALIGSLAMVPFARMVRADAPAEMTGADIDAAAQSAGGAVAVAESLGGATGAELLEVVREALATGTQVAYMMAFVLGLVVVGLIVAGLRGVTLPGGDGNGTAAAAHRDASDLNTELNADHGEHPMDAVTESLQGRRIADPGCRLGPWCRA